MTENPTAAEIQHYASQEHQGLIRKAIAEHQANLESAVRRFYAAIDDAERVYRLRLTAIQDEPA